MVHKENQKSKLKRVYTCSVCNSSYEAKRHSTSRYCSDKCRKAASRTRTSKRRIESLPLSDEWLWVSRECRRAGTVECLQDVDLVSLFALYRARFKCYGWDAEKKTSKFHLCHIAPVQGKSAVGLLHHLNLFIGSSLPNQVHGNNSYPDRGLSIKKSVLKRKWMVDEGDNEREILDKVTRYLGPTLVEYAKDYPIRKSQRFSLARWVYQNDESNTLTLQQLERMSMSELRKIRARVEEKELYQMNVSAKRSVVVALEECERLARQLPEGQHKADLAFMVPVLRVAAAWLSRQDGQEGLACILERPYGTFWKPLETRIGADASAFRDFVGFQAFQALQGAPVDQAMVLGTLRKYLVVTSLGPTFERSSESAQEYFADEYARFRSQVPAIRDAILSLGIADKVMVSEYLESVKEALREEEIIERLGYTKSDGEYDYPDDYYQVEDDYVPNSNLKVFQEEVFVPF